MDAAISTLIPYLTSVRQKITQITNKTHGISLTPIVPKGDLWVQSPMIIVGQLPNIRSIAENRRRSTEAYRRVMSTWPSMMVGRA